MVGTNEGRSSSRSAWVEREARRDARYDSSDARGRDREEEGEGVTFGWWETERSLKGGGE